MERSPSDISEELIDLTEVLDYQPRLKPTRPRALYVAPVVPAIGDTRFPVIPSKQAGAGPQMTANTMRRKAELELKAELHLTESSNMKNLGLAPIYGHPVTVNTLRRKAELDWKSALTAEGMPTKNLQLAPIFDDKTNKALENAVKVAAIKAELAPSPQVAWKEEREQRIQNAMARVQQNYVSDVKKLYADNANVNDAKKLYADNANAKKLYADNGNRDGDNRSHFTTPKFLDPIKPNNQQVIWDEDRFRRSRRVTEKIQKTYVDDLRPSPPGMSPSSRRCTREEIEIDERRQDLLDQKEITEVEQALRDVNACIAQTAKPSNPCVPCPPQKPAGDREGYSKRKRKLKQADAAALSVADFVPAPPTAAAPSQRAQRAAKSHPTAATTVTASDAAITAAEPNHPALIPRQMTQTVRTWNSDTAKRGLGFKSKQRKRAEEEAAAAAASTGTSVGGSRSENIGSEVRNKWKKATFY